MYRKSFIIWYQRDLGSGRYDCMQIAWAFSIYILMYGFWMLYWCSEVLYFCNYSCEQFSTIVKVEKQTV